MQRNTVIAFVIIEAILISGLIVIATNENDVALNEQNSAQCMDDCGDCLSTCVGTCKDINNDCKSGDVSCTQSGSQLKNMGSNREGSCIGDGGCGKDQQNSGNCRVSSGCSGRCSD